MRKTKSFEVSKTKFNEFILKKEGYFLDKFSNQDSSQIWSNLKTRYESNN